VPSARDPGRISVVAARDDLRGMALLIALDLALLRGEKGFR
jgi:hypothetical protein